MSIVCSGVLMMGKSIILFTVSLLLLVLFSAMAHAIGLAGDGLYVQETYSPGETITYSYEVRQSSTDNEGTIQVFVEGDLSEYLHPSVDSITPSDGDSFIFTVDFIMEEDNLPEGGIQYGRVCAKEASSEDTGAVVALTQACAVFEILVLYDGKSPSLSFEIEESTGEIEFLLHLSNHGTEDIESSYASLRLYTPDGEEFDSLSIAGGTVSSSELITMSYSYDITSLTPGDYTALAVVTADDDTIELEKEFTVGSQDITLFDYTRSIELVGIQKLYFTVVNEWAEEQTVDMELNLGAETIDVEEQTIPAWSEAEFILYVDSSNFELGEYTGNLRISFGETLNEEAVTITFVEEGSLESEESSGALAGLAMSFGAIGENSTWLIGGGIGMLVVLLVVVLLYLRRRNYYEEEEDDDDDF